jgi:outer membrane protein assembly factor BamB
MTERQIKHISTWGSGGLFLLLLVWWLNYKPVADLTMNTPGMDNRPESSVASRPEVNIGEYFTAFEGTASTITVAWPRFRGTDYTNINTENIALADSWEEGGPPVLWSVELGEGHAGPAVANGCVYIMDYDEEKRGDRLRCFSLTDGREIWQRGYNVFIKRNHGMSRTIPAVTEKYVVSIGPLCHVMCVDALSGDLKWGVDLVKEYEAEVPLWYTGQCPLIDDSVAVIAVGGSVLMIGKDCETGEVLWETPNPQQLKMSHSSIIPYTIHGRRMYLYCGLGGVVGVSAEKGTAGEILFHSVLFNRNVIAPSPLYLGEGRLFLTAGYGGGSMMLRIDRIDNSFRCEAIQSLKPDEGLASEQQTPIYYKEHLFAILPKDAGPLRNQFVCVHPNDFSRIIWSSGKTLRFGLGPYLIADDKFYILSDDGVLSVAEATPREFKLLGQANILPGHDAWGPMALVQGLLLARDSRHLICVDLRASS